MFVCKFCNKKLTSQKRWDNHLKSKLHANKLRIHNKFENIVVENNDIVVENNDVVKNDIVVENNDVVENIVVENNDVVENIVVENDIVVENNDVVENIVVENNDVVKNDIVVESKDGEEFKFIDMFSGIGGFHQAFLKLERDMKFKSKCVLACDSDKNCRAVYFDNYGLEPHPNIKKIDEKTMDDFDALCGGFPCFVSGTKVLTQNGYKNIEDVVLDNKLMTHTGEFHKILNLQRKIYKGKLYNIKIKYHPNILYCTEEHPFYIRTKNKKWNSNLKKYDYTFDEPQWKTANKLTKNDYFGMKINKKNIIPEFNFNNKILKLDEKNMWFIMGYFIGNGCCVNTIYKKSGKLRNEICFCINEKHIELVINKCKNIIKLGFRQYSCKSGKASIYVTYSKLWFNIFKKFGKYAHGKIIPEWVQDAPKEFIQEFINGYKTADGCVTKNDCYSFTTVSYNLAFGLQRLYLKLGHLFSINKTIRPKTTIIEGRTVNQRDTYMIRGYTRENKRKVSSFIENDYVWYAPFKIETKDVEEEMVYNFEVENDNSYVVENTISHNCQPFSNGGKKQCFKDKKGLLFDEIIRIAKHKKPKFMFLENVKHILKVSDKKVIEYIKFKIDEIGYVLQLFEMSPHLYGIPQQRQRIFFVCVRKDLYNDKDIELIEDKLDKKPEDILEEKCDEKYNMKEDVSKVLHAWDELIQQFDENQKMSPTILINDAFRNYSDEEFKTLANWRKDYMTKNKPILKKYKKIIDKWYKKHKELLLKREVYGKLEWQAGPLKKDDSIFNYFIQIRQSGIRVKRNKYFPTLVAISQIPIFGKVKRHLTPRECARLQCFPEDFKLSGSDRASYKQFGNAVNVFNTHTIIKSTLKHYGYF